MNQKNDDRAKRDDQNEASDQLNDKTIGERSDRNISSLDLDDREM